jgi:surfactin family lipopeptide synthetase C
MTTAVDQKTYELTPTQQAMLFFSRYAPNSPAYFEQFCYSYRGPLNVPAFTSAWQRVIDRHPSLRTSFCWDDESGPRQIVHEHAELPFTFLDWRDLMEVEQAERLTEFLESDIRRGFDLSRAPLIRLAVIQTGANDFHIVISNHHLVLDGWSMGVIRGEVSEFYQASLAGKDIELPAAPDFGGYVERLRDEKQTEAETFWRQELAGFAAPNSLSMDKAPVSLPSPGEEFAEQMLSLTEELSNQLQACARRNRLTMSTLAQAAWSVLLSRYCNSDDVMFGITVSGRPYDFPEIGSMVGLMINTLPLRVRIRTDEPALSCFQRIQKKVSNLREHETASLTQIHKWSDLAALNTPLFETLVVFENFAGHDSRFELGGEIELQCSHLARTNYPLTLVVRPDAELSLQIIYHRSRFAGDSIQRMLNHLKMILESFAEGLEKRVSAVNMLSKDERHSLLSEWSGAGSMSPDLQPVHRMIELQAARTPDAIALEHEGRRLTYAELNAQANQLAHFLRTEKVNSESLVGICLERSFDMIMAVLAVMKAGGAYVPLDPAYPEERLTLMLEDSGARLLLTREGLRERLPQLEGRAIALDSEALHIAKQSAENLAESAALEDLAYVIYTSGSTGKPKGVMVEHRALANFASSVGDEYAIAPNDRVLQFASLCFDASAEEIFCALSRGATLVLRTDAMLISAKQFLQSCDRLGITVLDLPTGYWHYLTAAVSHDDLSIPKSCRLVILGGEQAKAECVTNWLARCDNSVRLLNTYGPTEATVVTTTFDLSNCKAGDAIPIGRPLRGASVYVLDRALQPVAAGLSGELYIGRAGVARGYLNRPELTAEKFVTNPFAEGTLYRSGDLVRYLPDGNLEFLGRVDNQVKIRGFRIELEEVEQAIRSHQGVSDAVVVMREDADGDKRLCAYIVPNEASQASTSEIRSILKRALPPHMVPATFTILDGLPLMANGKIDRNALPAPDSDRPEVDEHFISPRTPMEEFVASIWCDALKLDRVGVHDNFFDLGGHSLLAARVFAELQKKFKATLNLVDVFNAPTIAELAEMIYQRETSSEQNDELESLLSELDELTDEEANRWLSEESEPAQTATL